MVIREELVSIIIPVFNVEKYIDRCMKSIIQQTYTDLEIILVDDGSTDRSGDICDEWAKRDNRVLVIHKSNGGLSDARNWGMKNANGKYIAFIDSDDYISEKYICNIIEGMKETSSQIGTAEMEVIAEGQVQKKYDGKCNMCFSMQDAMKDVFYEKKLNTSACGKIFLRSLFENVMFPIGILYEDLATIYKVIKKVERIYYTNGAVYYYYVRPGSIVNSSLSKKHLDIFSAWNNIFLDITVEEDMIFKAFYSKKLDGLLGLLLKDTKNSNLNEKVIWNELKTCRKIVLFDNNAKIRIRLEALLSYLGKNICLTLLKKYYR